MEAHRDHLDKPSARPAGGALLPVVAALVFAGVLSLLSARSGVAGSQRCEGSPGSTLPPTTASPGGGPAPESGAPTPPPGDGPVTVQLVNPFAQSPAGRVSGRFDGVDTTFHVVAALENAPAGATVEAYVVANGRNERTIGLLCPTEGSPSTYERDWTPPADLAEGPAVIRVRVFDGAGAGARSIASDEVSVNLQHVDDASGVPNPNPSAAPAAETVELSWPKNGGALGFYKTRGSSAWKTTVRGRLSTGATSPIKVLYSTSPLSLEPRFVECGSGDALTTQTDHNTRAIFFVAGCTLGSSDAPSSVTAVAVSAMKPSSDRASPSDVPQSSDAHVVRPYVQDPATMKVTVHPVTPSFPTGAYPSGLRRIAGEGCLEFVARVVDHLGQPVTGANVDAIVAGPGDETQFAGDTNVKAPDVKAAEEAGTDCSGGSNGKQGFTVVPDGPNVKAVETEMGTDYRGEWRVRIASRESGGSTLEMWVDDTRVENEGVERSPDDDQRQSGESSVLTSPQWLDAGVRLRLEPHNASAAVGTCQRVELSLAGGDVALGGFNVDIHVRVADPELRLCDLASTDVLRPPDVSHKGQGHPADTPECEGSGPRCFHVEGVTNDAGKLTFGLTSAFPGTARVVAWADGEPGVDDDAYLGEVKDDIAVNFVGQAGQAAVRILNPMVADVRQIVDGTPRGDATTNGKVSGSELRVVARVNTPYLAPTLDVLVAPSGSSKYVRVGEAERVGLSDTYAFEWNLNEPIEDHPPTTTPSPSSTPTRPPRPTATPTPTETPEATPRPTIVPTVTPPPAPSATPPPTTAEGVPDGLYKLRLVIPGTAASDMREVEVNRVIDPERRDSTLPYERASLTAPAAGATLGFSGGSALITGFASAGSEGVDLFYSTATSKERPVWKMCGHVDLAPNGSAQSFSGECSLERNDNPETVSAVAAVAFSCSFPQPECSDPVPPRLPDGSTVGPGRSGAYGLGDAVRVYGCVGSPCVSLQPGEWQADVGGCVPFVVTAGDYSGEPVGGVMVAVSASGPADGVKFCAVEGGTPAIRPPLGVPEQDGPGSVTVEPNGPDTHHLRGFTDAKGQFVFGLTSSQSGYDDIYSRIEGDATQVKAGLDENFDGLPDAGSAHRGVMHWLLPDRCTVFGSADSEVIVGTSGDDKICTLDGDDVVFADAGNDIVLGGSGNDQIFGEAGDDLLLGELGNDQILGEDGRDVLRGGPGDDELNGGPGADSLRGGGGKNTCPDAKRSEHPSGCPRPPAQAAPPE